MSLYSPFRKSVLLFHHAVALIRTLTVYLYLDQIFQDISLKYISKILLTLKSMRIECQCKCNALKP